jgi:hypothetical protein
LQNINLFGGYVSASSLRSPHGAWSIGHGVRRQESAGRGQLAERTNAGRRREGRERQRSEVGGRKMQDARCRMQDAGCKMQDARCRIQKRNFGLRNTRPGTRPQDGSQNSEFRGKGIKIEFFLTTGYWPLTTRFLP